MKGKPASFYIVYSPSLDRYYIGITTDDVQFRLEKHNSSFYGIHYTSRAKDWELKLVICCVSYSVARKTELYVKKMKSRNFIERIIKDTNERNSLIEKMNSI